ncbi:MAG: ornithine cyclodeaminase family protein, partial [Halobacteria archaeon]|nr:ornithine cyclodeaminase family protein [Halobacteria archaeon]
RAEEFVEDESESERDLDVTAGSAEDVAGCDVISTTTPSRQPVLERGWIDDGTHINAMGADAEGKQELDPQILKDAKVVVDDWEQCKHSGEVNVPVSEGAIDRSDVHAEIGEVVAGEAPGREGDEITVFDSTGLAIQDVAASRIVYERGKKEDVGTPFSLVGTDTDS